jgi:bacterioferritin
MFEESVMKAKSIELLNRAIADEISAAHQYMYFHFHCDDQGYELLSSLFRRTAIEEMRHVEHLAERILFLKGEVELTAKDPVQKVHDVEKMLEFACASEEGAIEQYNRWANESSANADAATKKLFESLIDDEERHFDQFDTEMENLKKFGDRYLALQSIERSKMYGSGGKPE